MTKEDCAMRDSKLIKGQNLRLLRSFLFNKGDSIYGGKPLREIYHEIRDVYRRDDRPWVVGYSGGKVSINVLA